MERVPRILPADLDPKQRELYDSIVGGARARQASVLPLVDAQGSLEGPFGPLLHAPDVGAAVQSLGAVIRSGLSVDDRTREIATLWCAAASASPYELEAHRRLAPGAGLSVADVDTLSSGALPDTLSPRERAFAEAAVRSEWNDVDFTEASAVLGLGALVEAIALGGYYRLLAQLLHAFGVNEVSAEAG